MKPVKLYELLEDIIEYVTPSRGWPCGWDNILQSSSNERKSQLVIFDL